MRTETIQIFQYDELNAKAQERAREWFRQASAGDLFWSEVVIEDAVTCAAILGIKIAKRRDGARAIAWQGFSNQGDGASFAGSYTFAPNALAEIKSHAPEDEDLHNIADGLADLQKTVRAPMTAKITTSGRGSGDWAMACELYAGDDSAEYPQECAALELFRDFAKWIYRQLEREYEYRQSDDTVAEDIRANEYDFTADGKRWPC